MRIEKDGPITSYMEHFSAKCPHCNKIRNSTSSIGEETYEPGPGDITVCCKCLTVLQFTDDYRLKKVKLSELSDDLFIEAMNIRRMLIESQKPKQSEPDIDTPMMRALNEIFGDS